MLALLGTIAPYVVPVIARAFKGPNAKANASGVAGGATAVIVWPLVDKLMGGIIAGAGPELEQAGVLIGSAVVGWIVNRATTWLTSNEE